MVEPLRHRQTKEAATDMFYLPPPRHISTLPFTSLWLLRSTVRMSASHPKATESPRSSEMTRCAITSREQMQQTGSPVIRSPRRHAREARLELSGQSPSQPSNSLTSRTWSPDRSVSRSLSCLSESGRHSQRRDGTRPRYQTHRQRARQRQNIHGLDKRQEAVLFRQDRR